MKHHIYASGKFAFTLAEVLITLAIIGIVAALTMPALLAHHQKQVLVTQLKKEYSAWSQAFQALLADEGVDKLSDTSVWGKLNGYCSGSALSLTYKYTEYSVSSEQSGCGDFLASLQKYIKFEIPSEKESNEYNIFYGSTGFIIKNQNGSFLNSWEFYSVPDIKTSEEIEFIKANGGTMFSEIAFLFIDVNGYKKPNIMGRDLFYFYISDEGKLYPSGGKDYALYVAQTPLESNGRYWKNDSYYVGCDPIMLGKGGYGAGCAARIMENGWKMDY